MLLISPHFAAGQLPVLTRSDVVFMYQAPRGTYEDYGATVLAWGGTPRPESLAEARGLKFFGSVGMVTEFSRYYEQDPATYAEGLCRDLEGKPFKVPWLIDHQHKGIPYWWCCTRQPRFRSYIENRVRETVQAGAFGVHIDDHLGTAGALWMGGCFCDRCADEFRDYLRSLPAGSVPKSIETPAEFDFPRVLKAWLTADPSRKITGHPLWPEWRTYQLRGAAAFMAQLRELATKAAGRPVPMSANACLTWGPHLNDYLSLDFFSAEIEHHAPARKMSDDPIVAYRMADAVKRPLASTASGGDWAFIKEQNLPGLVCGWIALGYAAGNSLMAPNRQWCYTKEKGTHWYAGPRERFAPLYRFVRDHARLFDGFESLADVVIAYGQRTYDRDAASLMNVCRQLSNANLSYRLALGGDRVVRHSIPAEDLSGPVPVLVLKRDDFEKPDQETLARVEGARLVTSADAAISQCSPCVGVETSAQVRVFPRVKPGAAVLHIVNWNYDSSADLFVTAKDLRLRLNLARLGMPEARSAIIHAPAETELRVGLKEGALLLPELRVWGVVELSNEEP